MFSLLVKFFVSLSFTHFFFYSGFTNENYDYLKKHMKLVFLQGNVLLFTVSQMLKKTEKCDKLCKKIFF